MSAAPGARAGVAMSERDTIPATCPRCGRPSWQRHGGMGGGIMPDAETHCLQPSGMWCRVAAAGYAAGRASHSLPSAEVLALLRGLVAERTGGVAVPHAPWCRVLDALDELDKAAAAAKGGDHE